MFLYAIEAIIVAVLAAVLLTQVMVPVAKGLPLFPFFRRRAVARELARVADEREVLLLRKQLEEAVEENRRLQHADAATEY